MKGISTINPAITENTEFSIIKMHAISINIKVGVSLDRGLSVHFVLLPALQHFGQHSKLRTAPASTELV